MKSTWRNPNSLPSSTNVRFILLVSTVTLMALWYGNEVVASLRFMNGYTKPLNLQASSMVVAGVWLTSILVYAVHPFFCTLAFKGKLRRAPEDFLAEVEYIAESVGLRRVAVVVDDNIKNFDAIAYGYPFRRKVAFGRGNLLLRRKRPDIFLAKAHHELSHIRNHDVDTGFFSVAFLFAGGALVAASATYWLCNFLHFVYLYESDEIFAIYTPRGVFWRYGSPLAIVGVMWMAALWLEHRSFVRSRELMADAEAAFRCGAPVVQEAIGLSGVQSLGSSVGTKLRTLFRAHPSKEHRRNSLNDLPSAGLLRWPIFIVVGYLFSVLDSLSAITQGMYGAGDTVDQWSCASNDCISKLVGLVTSDGAYLFVSAIGMVLLDAVIVLVVSSFLRAGLQSRLLDVPGMIYIVRCFYLTFAFWLGYIIGDLIDPFYFKILLATDFVEWKISYSSGVLKTAAISGCILFCLSISFYVFANFLFGGRRERAVPQAVWILFCSFMALSIGQILLTPKVVLLAINLFSRPGGASEGMPVVIGAIIGLVVWISLATITAFVIRNGGQRLGQLE